MIERKVFLSNSKHQYRASQCQEYDSLASNKKDGDYYEYPSLSHLTDEKGKWWKGKHFLQIQSINIVYPNNENMIVVPIIKKWRLLWASKFASFQR